MTEKAGGVPERLYFTDPMGGWVATCHIAATLILSI